MTPPKKVPKLSMQRSARAWRIWKDLNWLKDTAIERLNEETPNLEIDSVNIIEIGYQPKEKKIPVEEGDIILWIHLSIYIDNVTMKQIERLNHAGTIKIYEVDGHNRCQVEYKTAYAFEFWHSKIGKGLLEDGFSGFDYRD